MERVPNNAVRSTATTGTHKLSAFRPLALAILLVLLLASCDPGNQGPGTSGQGAGSPTATTAAVEQPTGEAAQATATVPAAPSPAAAGSPTTAAGADTFRNPVFRNDFPDPFVLEVDGTYYAYATNGRSRNIQMARSKDLVTWELLSDAMPAPGKWAQFGGGLIWAPEVIKLGDKYVMYYTARDKESDKQCVGISTSDKPEGKFTDLNDKPFICQADEGGTIDASPFLDGDKLYLYYKNDGNCCDMATYIYVQEMAPDGLSLVGEPVRLIRNDRQWEGRVVEAPTMWKHEDQYYLFFSGNNYGGFEYAVGYANCTSPMGPCKDAQENPILASKMEAPNLVIGPGHQTIVLDKDGDPWMVYHAWDVTSSGTRGSSRFMWIDRVEWKDGKPDVLGPTTDPQPKP